MVSNSHVTAIIASALAHADRHEICWYANPVVAGETDREDDGFARGEAWGDLATVQQRRRSLTVETAESWGAVLVAQNRRSVDYRYDESEWEQVYTFPRSALRRVPLSPVELLRAINGYEYQACETPDWYRTEARQLLDVIRDVAVRALPGYEDGPWSISEGAW